MPPSRPPAARPGLADLKRLSREAARAREIEAREHALRAAGDPRGGTQGPGTAPRSGVEGGQQPSVPPSSHDLALFRRVAGDVEQVDTRNRRQADVPTQVLTPRKARGTPADNGLTVKPPQALQPSISDADVSHLLVENGTAYLRQGVGPDVLKKLAQRYWRLEADLDLHGLTVDHARSRLAAFVMQCVAYDVRCIRIVHGQGFGSPESQPVLRDKVRAWLVGLADVRAFAQATPRDGGAGATIALLRVDERRGRDRRDTPAFQAEGGRVSRT